MNTTHSKTRKTLNIRKSTSVEETGPRLSLLLPKHNQRNLVDNKMFLLSDVVSVV